MRTLAVATYLCATFLILCPEILLASNDDDDFSIRITRTQENIQIDGVLDEAIWQNADIATDFWMSFPVDDRKADRKTEVRLTYDENTLRDGFRIPRPNQDTPVTCYQLAPWRRRLN